jgi:hypothetical protein
LYRSSKAQSHLKSLQSFVKNWDRVETFGLGKVYKKDLTVFLDDVDAILEGLLTSPKQPLHSAAQSPKHADPGVQYYNVTNRKQLIKEWRAYCMELQD